MSSSPHVKMETDSVSETFSNRRIPDDGQSPEIQRFRMLYTIVRIFWILLQLPRPRNVLSTACLFKITESHNLKLTGLIPFGSLSNRHISYACYTPGPYSPIIVNSNRHGSGRCPAWHTLTRQGIRALLAEAMCSILPPSDNYRNFTNVQMIWMRTGWALERPGSLWLGALRMILNRLRCVLVTHVSSQPSLRHWNEPRIQVCRQERSIAKRRKVTLVKACTLRKVDARTHIVYS
jgi:hypothetical protein